MCWVGCAGGETVAQAELSPRRSDSIQIDSSPSQLLMGSNIRTKLITLPHNLTPHWHDQTVVRANDERMTRRTAESYNWRKGARPLPPLGKEAWLGCIMHMSLVLVPHPGNTDGEVFMNFWNCKFLWNK